MAVCTTNLGLQHCRQDPNDPEALRFGLQMLNKVIDIIAQFKLGGRQLRNDQGVFIRNDNLVIIRIPWVIGPGQDLPGLWAGPGTGGVLPPGIIVAWSGYVTNIPDGFTLCDGNNGAPDLRSKFILGAAGGAIGGTGGFSRHGAGINDHLDHDPPGDHTDPLNISIDNHTRDLDHVIYPHTGTFGLDLDPHIDTIEHAQPGDHDPHVHDKGLTGAAFDVLDGINALDVGDSSPNVITSTVDAHEHTMVVGTMLPVGGGDTGEESHALIHGTIEHLGMQLDHTGTTSEITHTHDAQPHRLDFDHTITGNTLDLDHEFSGDHSWTDNRGPYMLLCWIMKLAEAHQTFPNTPFS